MIHTLLVLLVVVEVLVADVELVVEVMVEELVVVVEVLIVELQLVPGLVVVKLQVSKLLVGLLVLQEVGVPSSVMIAGHGPAHQEDEVYSVMSAYMSCLLIYIYIYIY